MLTEPMTHQRIALERLLNRKYFGLFMEQGTGKTWCLLADAERLYAQRKIEAVLVIAPNGVHTNWARCEIPQHVSIPHRVRIWRSGAGKRYMSGIEEVMERSLSKMFQLRILCMNIEAIITEAGFQFAKNFLKTFPSMLIIDESADIKNPTAARTKAAMRLRKFALYARIADGAPATNAPTDIFSQMEFLHSGLLRTTNYRVFVTEYAELMKPSHPMMQRMIQRNPRVANAQIIARDDQGKPKYRNLKKLHKLLEPHTYRIRKDQCMDLPEKIYTQRFFTLSPKQLIAYRLMKQEQRMTLGETLVPVQALAAGLKLQQITSGFLLHEGTAHYVEEGNMRLAMLMSIVETLEGSFIVWAHFREEIEVIAKQFCKANIPAVTYYGATSMKDREAAVDAFQEGAVRAFIANPQAAGKGRTLTAAHSVIYYSNDFSLRNRIQSEDRCHRKGTTHHVVYIDLIAENTIDETIVHSLQTKTDMAAAIVGDITS